MRFAKRVLSVTLSVALVLAGEADGSREVSAASVRLNKSRILIRVGQKYRLKLKGVKASAHITWKSSKKKIAAVNSKGRVTAKKKGFTKVTVTYGTKKYVCRVTVKKKRVIPVEATKTPAAAASGTAVQTSQAPQVTEAVQPAKPQVQSPVPSAADIPPAPTDNPGPDISSAPVEPVTDSPARISEAPQQTEDASTSKPTMSPRRTRNPAGTETSEPQATGGTEESPDPQDMGSPLPETSPASGAAASSTPGALSTPGAGTPVPGASDGAGSSSDPLNTSGPGGGTSAPEPGETASPGTEPTTDPLMPLSTLEPGVDDPEITAPPSDFDKHVDVSIVEGRIYDVYPYIEAEDYTPPSDQSYECRVVLKVTNNNEVWLDDTDISCDFRDAENKQIDAVQISMKLLAPGEERYYAVKLSCQAELVSLLNSTFTVAAYNDGEYGRYYDYATGSPAVRDITYTAENATETNYVDEAMGMYMFTLENQSDLAVKGTYICTMYDADDNIIEIISKPYEIDAAGQYQDSVDLPTKVVADTSAPEQTSEGDDPDEGSEEEDTVQYTDAIRLPARVTVETVAHSFEAIDHESEMSQNVGITIDWTKKIAGFVQLKVTNNNDSWIGRLSLEGKFCDADGNELETGSAEVGSIAPGETIYTVVTLSDSSKDAVKAGDDAGLTEWTAEAEDMSTQYAFRRISSGVSTTVTTDEDGQFIMTVANSTAKDVEVNLVLYKFPKSYAMNKNAQALSAEHFVLSLGAGDKEEIVVDPFGYDADGNEKQIVFYLDRIMTAHVVEDI